MEFGEQFGLVSGARVRVEPHPGFLLHCRLQLAGGGDYLGRGLRADPRDGLQPVRPSRSDRGDRPEAGLLDGGEPQAALGDLLDPVKGHLRQLRADNVAADRLVGTARRLAACLRGREGVGDRDAQCPALAEDRTRGGAGFDRGVGGHGLLGLGHLGTCPCSK